MKIKSQFIICIGVFSIILLVIAASVANTELQVAKINAQEQLASNIERGASSLNSVSIDYFLYQEDLQLSKWQSQLSSLSSDLDNLKPNTLQQQTLANKTAEDLQTLNVLFGDVHTYLQSASRNVSVRIDPAFQMRWSSMSGESLALASDSSQLSSSLSDQAHQVNETNIYLIVSLVATFGALLATIYLMVFRRTLKSVAELQKGINTIGSGNLDYVIELKRQDEISELSNSFNQMTSDLKNVTASKTDLEQAQASLRASEQRWSTTLASIGDAVIATDLSGKITFMNGKAENLTGWTLSEASLKPVKEIFNIVNEQTRLEVENPVTKVLEKGIIVGLANHTVLIRKDATEIPIDDSGAPIKSKDGKTTGVVLIFRDITERKKAEEALIASEQKANDLIKYAPSGIYELDYRIPPKFRSVNDAMCQILGYTREELFAMSPFALLDDESKTRFRERIMKMLAGEKVDETVEFKVITKNGQNIDAILDTTFTYKDGKPDGALVVAHDITERKKAERALEERAKNLESLVEERTKALRDSERLAAIGATAGMVGHDIRNPLQAITGDVYLAKTELAEIPESPEKQNTLESLQEIEKNIDYINKIVADLQDFARPLKPHMEEADLKQIITDLLAKNGLPKNVKVTVKVDSEAQKVLADSSYINRIMYNLVTNAVQAMPNGGKLNIHAFRDKKTEDAIITVADTGVGIPEAIRGKLFTPMFTTKSKGQGFGLAVIKRMAEALSGSVVFESEENKGTKFIVRLPQNVKKKTDF
jgi:PAS domain S-box-containing protein